MMRLVLSVGAALLLVLGIAAVALAATPDGKTAATAIPLPVSVSASGTLTGTEEGSFAYYEFDYPGDGSTGTITLNVTPTDSNTTNAVGVNLYQNGVTLRSLNALGSTSGSNTGLFSSTTAGPVLVQVYNYLPGQTATYLFSITGAGTTSPVTPREAMAVAPSTPVPATGSGGATPESAFPLLAAVNASGTLAGDSNGSFYYYTFDYPGKGSLATVKLDVTPTDPNLTNAVGVNLYQNGTNLQALNALGTVSGTNFTTFSSQTAGPVTIQVYNYLPGETATYHLTISGVAQ